MENKREILKEKVVSAVKDFIKTEGGITHRDLVRVFGPSDPMAVDSVMYALDHDKINFLS